MNAVKQIDANGLRFTYLEEGTGPLVLLLHGFPDTPRTWDQVRPALAGAGWRAVSPFMRGYFPTEIPKDKKYDTDTLGQDVLSLIAALGSQPAIVVGHDWGAAAAYSAASVGAERVCALVTVGIPHPAAIPRVPRVLWGGRHFFRFQTRDAASFTRANDFAYVDVLVRRWSPKWDVPPEETRAVKEVFRQPGSLEAAISYYLSAFQVPSSLRRKIGVPTAAFAPIDDGIFRVSDYERARRCFSGRYAVIECPGGHFAHREHPAHFIPALLRVLDGMR